MSQPEPPANGQATEIVPEVEKALRDKSLPPEFKTLSPDVQRRVLMQATSVAIKVSHESWEGSFPPPQAIQQFEEILPGSGDRIFAMTEKDLAHRHTVEGSMVSYMLRGQILGFILAAIALIGSIILIAIGQVIPGGLIGSAVLIPLVALFVTGQLHSINADDGEKPKGNEKSVTSPPAKPRGNRPQRRR